MITDYNVLHRDLVFLVDQIVSEQVAIDIDMANMRRSMNRMLKMCIQFKEKVDEF